jgi:hypothetical protein
MRKYLPLLVLISGIIFATIVWDFISFPYDTSNTIIGEYSSKKISPLNDTARGLFFIFFPLLLYSLLFFRFNNQHIKVGVFQNYYQIESYKNVDYLCFILIIFSLLEFLSLDYKNFLGTLDTHHEGTFLTAQLNLYSKNKFWTGTFFDYGFLGNNLGVFFNFIFGEYNIGIQRFSLKFLILINKILLVLICRKIIINLNLARNKDILFLIFSLSTTTLVSFYDHVTPFHSRIFIFLVFTLLIFNIVSSNKNSFFICLITGFFSLLSILFYWDIGTYINILLIFFLSYLLLINQYNDVYKILLGLILSWLIFYILIPSNEFKEFINQYFIIVNISDYLIGIEYPKPFSDKSTRHTKALLLIILSGVFVINFIFNKTKEENLNSKFFLVFLFISSIIFFKSGLMRSDSPHIKYTSGIYTLLIFFFISYYLVNFFNNFKISIKINNFFENKKYFFISTIFICFFFFFQNNFSNLINILNPNKNFIMLKNTNDKMFLDNDYFDFIELYKNLIKNESCIQQFTDDNALPYLVNKPTCTKYYVNAHIVKNWTENNFIKELKESSPNYIIYSSEINWFKERNNAPNADKYILDNYSLYKDLTPWQIYKKNSF